MQVDIIRNADEELYEAFQRLTPQLTNNNPPPTLDHLIALVQDPASTLLVARDENNAILGALTLTVYRVPTGIRSIIEDVIVDQRARGQGIGKALMERGIELARQKGAANISLTSNPMRTSANELYLQMGFNRRETNSYQMKL
jgi:ribosomal protein S18 acetylase RimI-like enzyme